MGFPLREKRGRGKRFYHSIFRKVCYNGEKGKTAGVMIRHPAVSKEVEEVGMLYMIIASLLYGIAPSVQKVLLLEGLTPVSMVVVCNGFAVVFSLIFCLVRHQSLRVSGMQLLQLAMVGGIGMGVTAVLLNLAYLYLPVGFVTMIHFMFPAIICFVMAAFFRERLTLLKVGGVVLSIAGLALISGGSFEGGILGILLALASSFTYSFFLIANEKWSIRTLPQMTLTFYINLFVVVVNFLLSQATVNVYPQQVGHWLLCALIGAMFCSGITMIEKGVSKLGAGTSSFFNMLEPVVSLIVSTVAYQYAISCGSAFGCLLILGSMLLVALNDRRRGAATEPRQTV